MLILIGSCRSGRSTNNELKLLILCPFAWIFLCSLCAFRYSVAVTFSIFICLFMKVMTSQTSSLGTPASIATFLACVCRFILFIPSVTNTCRKEKLIAIPAHTMIYASSQALGFPRRQCVCSQIGFDVSAPPLVAIAIGSLHFPTRFPFSRVYFVSGWYVPEREAHAYTLAFIARKSCPVAMDAASMPYISPLLCVVARQISVVANSHVQTIFLATSLPISSIGIAKLTLVILSVQKLDITLMPPIPPVTLTMSLADFSHIMFTKLDPILSYTSISSSAVTNFG